MMLRVGFLLMTFLALLPGLAAAQQAWVQIEARPTEAAALQRAEEWQGRLPDVKGYRLRSGWHAIALGPYDPQRAEAELIRLRASGLIPRDSFIADGARFVAQVFPRGSQVTGEQTTADTETEAPPPPESPEETVAESRASERTLTREEREDVQRALRWKGFYQSTIDGDFGAGSRRAMGAWQVANNFESTGVLSTAQRTGLVDEYRAAIESLGLERVVDLPAGIEIDMPAGIVEFTRYDAPFALYEAPGGGLAKVVLISQTGDRSRLGSLYDVIQTLEIIPPAGDRQLNRFGFEITGIGSKVLSQTSVSLEGDEIKGFTLVWPADDPERFRLAAEAIRTSFTRVPGSVLPDSAGNESTVQDPDLFSGLSVRKPIRARSGFYVDRGGAVVTVAEAVEGCGRVEIGEDVTASVAAMDQALGVALLRPDIPQQPLRVAQLATVEPRLKSELALSGYSYEGLLGAPSTTFGTLQDVRGLDGDTALRRLDLPALPGDVGGPILDGSGAVAAMLLPRPEGSRQLPDGVSFGLGAESIAAFLAANGVVTEVGGNAETELDAVDLSGLGSDLTVLVSCWLD